MVVVVERLRVRASVEEAMSTSPTPLTVLRHIHRSFYSILCGCALSLHHSLSLFIAYLFRIHKHSLSLISLAYHTNPTLTPLPRTPPLINSGDGAASLVLLPQQQ